MRGDLNAALDAANRLIEASPTDGEALMLRALIHLRRADYKHARRDAQRAAELYPDSPQIDAASAEIEFQCSWMEGKPQDALKALEWTLRKDADSVGSHIARGQALLVLDKPDDAKKAFEKALEMDPVSAEACAELARLELHENRIVNAKPWIARAKALNADSPQVRLAQAQWELATIRPDLAEDLAKGIWEDKAASPTVRLQALCVLASVSAAREKWRDVDRIIKLMEQINPGSPEVLVVAAENSFTLGEPENARSHLSNDDQTLTMLNKPIHPLVVKLIRKKGR